ncbi:hypothetical protein BACEGG_02955 [Bacteroides eggerthii DSM 20697]|nr:hypothetical protein BACEGG_02955 [Bacteroides eggerthii DSM 20697]
MKTSVNGFVELNFKYIHKKVKNPFREGFLTELPDLQANVI